MEKTPVTRLELEAHVAAVQAIVSDGIVISAMKGRKYVRIVSTSFGSRSVHHFVRLSDGAILKSASWKAPAKHSRGNIRREDLTTSLGDYGAYYLR